MQKKQLTLIGSVVLAVILVGFGGFFLNQKIQSPTDGKTKDDYDWFVEYTFKNGTYDMKTESAFKDNGTYTIVKRFEDNVSLQISKTSATFNKTYDIYISKVDANTIMIDGMKLYKKK